MRIKKQGNGLQLVFGKEEVALTPFGPLQYGEKQIDWPGEYEFGGIFFHQKQAADETMGSKVVAEELRFFSPAKTAFVFEEENGNFLDFDVLLVFGESSEMSKKDWKTLIEEVEPRVICFCESGAKTEELKKELSVKEVSEESDAVLEKGKLPADKTLYIQLT